MVRGGMRVGEVLKLTPRDVHDQKLTIQSSKSGKDAEVVFILRKVADRLRAHPKDRAVEPEHRIFPITYAAARIIVKNAGKLVGIELRPHDLKRPAATFASRSGVPIEIVSKVILRHSNLSTTQRYLGKISDSETTRWIENLYG
jgi:integrase/recombinase XerD